MNSIGSPSQDSYHHLQTQSAQLPGGLVSRIQRFHRRGPGLIPSQRSSFFEVSHAAAFTSSAEVCCAPTSRCIKVSAQNSEAIEVGLQGPRQLPRGERGDVMSSLGTPSPPLLPSSQIPTASLSVFI